MKKLIKLITSAFLLAALFTSCGNPAETAPEQDDGVTVEQFIEKLIDFNEGITADGQFRITFETEGWMFYKKNGTNWEAASSSLSEYKISKKSNSVYLQEHGVFTFSFISQKLHFGYCDEEELKNYFNNQPDNTLIFSKN